MTVEDLVLDQYDAEVYLLQRDGAFHHGYVRVPERDNLVHRIELTPTPPLRFVNEQGETFDPPKKMRGSYAYKNKDFNTYKGQYFSGKLKIVREELAPLEASGDRLNGVLDILIHGIDVPNTAGRNNHDLVYRIDLKDLSLTGSPSEQSFWQYPKTQDNKGADAPRQKRRITASWQDEAWKAAKGTAYASGKEWPFAHGPFLSGSAHPYDGELVNSLHDAELVWVAEDVLPSGRSGGMSRGGFAMFPYEWTTIGYGGYGAPIIADDKVFVYVNGSNLESYKDNPELANNPYVRLGIDERALAGSFKAYQDMLYCFDARTGKRLWVYAGSTGGLQRESKSGMASTPAYHDGKVYFRGMGGLHALDADSGEVLWKKGGVTGVAYGIGSAPHEGSVVMVNNTLILMNRGFRDSPGHTAGINPEDGSLLWKHDGLGGSGVGLPGLIEYQGEQVLALPRGLQKKDKRNPVGSKDGVVLVHPRSGDILLDSPEMGGMNGQVLGWKDMLLGNGRMKLSEEPKKSKAGAELAGFTLKGDSLSKSWHHAQIPVSHSRTLSVLHDGIYYAFTRNGSFGVDAESGSILARKRHIYTYTGGSHNWTWHVATNDRVITSGLAMMTTADQGMNFLPGRLGLDITSGYSAPTKPAISDGRIVLRLADKLVCYDLRKKEQHENTQIIELTANDAFPGIDASKSNDVQLRLRVRDDELISVMANWPRVVGPERSRIATWLGEDGHLPWRHSSPTGLKLSETGLQGESLVRISHMEEPWKLELSRDGKNFSGSYTRQIPAIRSPVENKGGIQGNYFTQGETEQVWNMYMTGAMANRSLKDGKTDVNFSIVVVTDGQKILRSWAYGGRLNTVAHEVDASKLRIGDGSLEGEVTVLFHDDQYMSLNPDASMDQYRQAAQSAGVAATYTVNAKHEAEKITGSYSGLVGHAFEISGSLSGSLQDEQALLGLQN